MDVEPTWRTRAEEQQARAETAEARAAELERRVSNLKNALFEIAGLRRTSIRWPEIANAAIDRDGMKGQHLE